MLCDQFSSEETAADKPEREVITRKMYVCSSVCAGSGENGSGFNFLVSLGSLKNPRQNLFQSICVH